MNDTLPAPAIGLHYHASADRLDADWAEKIEKVVVETPDRTWTVQLAPGAAADLLNALAGALARSGHADEAETLAEAYRGGQRAVARWVIGEGWAALDAADHERMLRLAGYAERDDDVDQLDRDQQVGDERRSDQ